MSEAASDLSPMESPDSRYTSSPSASPKHNGHNALGPSSEDGNKISSCLRLLVSNTAAGSIIGKGGSTINEFQSQSGARIQLSRNHEYFPGTTDRIIQITGSVNEILAGVRLILSKLFNETEDSNDLEEKTGQIRLVLPNSVCGGIIGKGGSTIKSFVEDSQASIKLSSQDQNLPGVTDRLVTISGTLGQQERAVFLIISKLAEDPTYTKYANTPFSYSGLNFSALQGIHSGFNHFGYGLHSYGAGLYGLGARNNKGAMPPLVPLQNPVQIGVPLVAANAHTSIKMAVPDERVGALVGRGGRTILEIQQVSGARIKISDRGDFISGTNNREVTISGTVDSVQHAKQLVDQRLSVDLDR